jgi:hypothetical protein
MNAGAVRHPDHSPVATSGTGQAFLDQPTKRLGIALLRLRPHDRGSPPVRRGILLALRRGARRGPRSSVAVRATSTYGSGWETISSRLHSTSTLVPLGGWCRRRVNAVFFEHSPAAERPDA